MDYEEDCRVEPTFHTAILFVIHESAYSRSAFVTSYKLRVTRVIRG